MKNFKQRLGFLILFSSAFSGGYKAFAVLFISLLFSEALVRDFNSIYFIVLMCSSLGVIPLSTLMTAKDFQFSRSAKLFWLVNFSLLSCLLILLISPWIHTQLDLSSLTVLFFSVVCVGGYEIAKREYTNRAMFFEIFKSGIASTLFLIIVLVLFWYGFDAKVEPLHLIMAFSICFFSPILGAIFREFPDSSFLGGVEFNIFVQKYMSVFLSNATSSLLSFILPLVIIALLQDRVSPYLAVIFSVANLFLLVPRFLAEKNIPQFRVLNDQQPLADKTFNVTLLYVVSICVLAFAVFWFLPLADFLLYFLLFSSVLFTQLALPYANVLMVASQFSELMKANLYGQIPFIFLTVLLFLPVSAVDSAYVVVLLYIFSSLIKLILTRKYCNPIFRKVD